MRLRVKCHLLYAKSLITEKRYHFAIKIYLEALSQVQIIVLTLQDAKIKDKIHHNRSYKIKDIVSNHRQNHLEIPKSIPSKPQNALNH